MILIYINDVPYILRYLVIIIFSVESQTYMDCTFKEVGYAIDLLKECVEVVVWANLNGLPLNEMETIVIINCNFFYL